MRDVLLAVATSPALGMLPMALDANAAFILCLAGMNIGFCSLLCCVRQQEPLVTFPFRYLL